MSGRGGQNGGMQPPFNGAAPFQQSTGGYGSMSNRPQFGTTNLNEGTFGGLPMQQMPQHMPQQMSSFPGITAQSQVPPPIPSLPTNYFQGPGANELSTQAFTPYQGAVTPLEPMMPGPGPNPFLT